jgi:hypothetical protein
LNLNLIDDKSFEIAFRNEMRLFELAYWAQYGITSEVLKKYCVKAVDYYILKGSRYNSTELVFAYEIEAGKCYKIYKPNSTPKYKFLWLGSKPKDFIFGFDQLPAKDKLYFLAAGEKDTLSLVSHSYSAFTLNSETADLPEWLVNEIQGRGELIPLYDNDETGVTASEKICKQYGLRRCILPDNLKEFGLKDASDYFSDKYFNNRDAKDWTFESFDKIGIKETSESEPDKKVDILEFPINVYPDEIQELIRQAHENSNVPIDYFAGSILVAAATAVGNKSIGEFKSWEELPIIYLALVGSSSQNKSQPISLALYPFYERDKLSQLEYKSHTIDVINKFTISDSTLEGMQEIVTNNPHGYVYHRDELSAWFNDFGRYRKGSDTEFWMSAWSGMIAQVDRTSKHLFIPDPRINVLGGIVPSTLIDIVRENRGNNGFLQRMLFCYPPKKAFIPMNDKKIDPKLLARYNGIIDSILDNELPKKMQYSDAASLLIYDWDKKNVEFKNTEPNDSIVSMCGKLDIYIHRLALTLHVFNGMANESCDEIIRAETVEKAIKLIEYFRQHNIKVYKEINSQLNFKNIEPKAVAIYLNSINNDDNINKTLIAKVMQISRPTLYKLLK